MRTTLIAAILIFLLTASSWSAPIIRVYVDTLRFGSVSSGGTHDREFAVSNIGNQRLIVQRINLGDSSFRLLYPPLPDSLMPGDTTIYKINFHPADELSHNVAYSINSNDPVTPNYRLPARAQGVRVFAPGEIIWGYQGIEDVVSCAPRDDINNDGFEDVVAESFDAGATGDNLLCISGSGLDLGDLIWSARPLGGPSNSGGYDDQCLITIDDLNGNRTQDIILGTAWGSRTLFAIEGRTGQTIWSYDTYRNPPSGWFYSVASMGDLNGDQIPEVIAGAGSDANAGFCFGGNNGQRRWRLEAGDVIYSVCRVDDISGDGIADAVMGAGDNDYTVYCVSGASQDSATVIWTYNTGGSVMSLDRIGDLNNDSYNDVIAGVAYNGHHVIALSGHSTGHPAVIWNLAVGQPITRVVVCPDLNGDGHEDVLVASWANYALALSGADGEELWRNEAGSDVWAIYWSYDLTGDSIPEAVAGSFNGDVILINGASGETVWSSHTDARIFTVRPIRDVNGDGFADIIAGQQMLQGVGGKVFLISGGTLNPDGINEGLPVLPRDCLNLANYPNPFNASTLISYALPSDAPVKLEIFNLLGQRVAVLTDEFQKAGAYQVFWNARNEDNEIVSTGVYFGRIRAAEMQSSILMTLLK